MDKIRGFFDNGGADIAIGTLNNASALILNDVVPLLNDTVLPVRGARVCRVCCRCPGAGGWGQWAGQAVAGRSPTASTHPALPPARAAN